MRRKQAGHGARDLHRRAAVRRGGRARRLITAHASLRAATAAGHPRRRGVAAAARPAWAMRSRTPSGCSISPRSVRCRAERRSQAIAKPPRRSGRGDRDRGASTQIVAETRGYPYFLQEWGKHAWDAAEASPITRGRRDATRRQSAVAALDESFFRVRFDRLTPAEKRYLRAMAELGPGPHRSGDIADCLRRKVTSLGPTRNNSLQGHDLESEPRRHGLHRAAVRRVHAAHHAR